VSPPRVGRRSAALLTLALGALATGGAPAAGGGGAPAPVVAPAPSVPVYDLVIRNGRVLDGAGNPWILADVAIEGGRFVRIGRVEGRGRREIDASGKYVSPGWIDMMDQSGGVLLRNGLAENKLRMGVTTAIGGEGGTPVPAREIPTYFATLREQGVGINFGTYFSAAQARAAVLGREARAPTPAELQRMQAIVELVVAHPLTVVASDGGLEGGRGHPRSSGTYARVLGRFVREANVVSWMEAVRKMSLMPAERLEERVPAMREKGRIRVGADADLVIFDPTRVIDRATYQEPALPSEGIRYVLVNGVPVVQDGVIRDGVAPGRGVRAARGGPVRLDREDRAPGEPP
jgi:N-acyl-D-aspartate/D-glutamate deacylase